ncbi:hypothetical protein GCM10010468_48350 [Actinocorallia longicatena]|uniref:Uncharacterized protein n=1 Tax=Actinocorallia longicatena TaxID=111803 RepID=A0ABP6QGI4_9ACTN
MDWAGRADEGLQDEGGKPDDRRQSEPKGIRYRADGRTGAEARRLRPFVPPRTDRRPAGRRSIHAARHVVDL